MTTLSDCGAPRRNTGAAAPDTGTTTERSSEHRYLIYKYIHLWIRFKSSSKFSQNILEQKIVLKFSFIFKILFCTRLDPDFSGSSFE